MTPFHKLKSLFRGNVRLIDLPREAVRRTAARERRRRERLNLKSINEQSARLSPSFRPSPDISTHFAANTSTFFPADPTGLARLCAGNFPDESARIIFDANLILDDKWDLAGFGVLDMSRTEKWRSDPLSGHDWGLDYHAELDPYVSDGPDIRVLWELNRMGHVLTLALAFALTNEAAYAEKFYGQIDDWMQQNPYGRGANWHSPMEVALRAINVAAAFDVFRTSEASDDLRVAQILKFFDQHGRFIWNNSEFSYISTSNHYLTNVAGMFWLGAVLPELEHAEEWRRYGLDEMLRQMDKQILEDGAHFESSTGYHIFISELLLYSFLLAKNKNIEIDDKYWQKLAGMFAFSFGVTRPDCKLPLIGDADGSRIVPLQKRQAGDVEHLLALAAVTFGRPDFRMAAKLTPEVIWLTGEKGIKFHGHLDIRQHDHRSAVFPHAGACVMRDADLYLHLNANDAGLGGRGSHAHNDALSIELSAFGRAMIVDPGSYVYNLDRSARHAFRSTRYHSTVVVDKEDQNTTEPELPFVMGNEAKPKVVEWRSTNRNDHLVAEHFGYTRLSRPVVHRRVIDFDKVERYWLIRDLLKGSGRHHFSFRFHLSPGLSIDEIDTQTVRIGDRQAGSLVIRAVGAGLRYATEAAFVSRGYGHREPSRILVWELEAQAPLTVAFIVVPCREAETIAAKLELLARVTENVEIKCAE